MGYSPVHTANFLLFLVLVLGALSIVEPQNEDLFFNRSYQNHGKSYQTHHNACSRKLMCLIASQKNGDIIQGETLITPKGPPINYVNLFWKIFDPLPPLCKNTFMLNPYALA